MRIKKKLLLAAALAVCSSTGLVQCTKDNTDQLFHVSFYTTRQTGEMFLFIDGVNKGRLSWFASMPPCGDTGGDVIRVPLPLELPSGEYQVVGKDEQGHVLCNSTMRISEHRKSVSGNMGGLHLASSDDCISVGLSE